MGRKGVQVTWSSNPWPLCRVDRPVVMYSSSNCDSVQTCVKEVHSCQNIGKMKVKVNTVLQVSGGVVG